MSFVEVMEAIATGSLGGVLGAILVLWLINKLGW